ncbi:hypothetical protein [Neglectibacter timonensis]|uniref:hypothetical protein n=1 Tax=Neglectibacter timonensis TaxID=1776382 RepID=UPI0039A31B28
MPILILLKDARFCNGGTSAIKKPLSSTPGMWYNYYQNLRRVGKPKHRGNWGARLARRRCLSERYGHHYGSID